MTQILTRPGLPLPYRIPERIHRCPVLPPPQEKRSSNRALTCPLVHLERYVKVIRAYYGCRHWGAEMLYPKVTIIVLNYNGLRFLPNCFRSLSRITYPDYEVILADNNSTDGSVAWFKDHYEGERYRTMPLASNMHYAGGNNAAAKTANGDYLFFINNDVRVKPDFVQNAMDVMLSDDAVGVCQSSLVDYSMPDDHEVIAEPKEILYAEGAALLISRRVFEMIGGFDDSFHTYVEDVDLSIRTRLMGYKVMLAPASVVFHIGNGTGVNLSGYGFANQARNYPMMMIKNLQLRNLIVAMPLFTVAAARRMMGNVLEGNSQATRSRLIGIRDFVKQLSSTYEKRKAVQRRRVQDDSTILKFTSLIDLAVKFRL